MEEGSRQVLSAPNLLPAAALSDGIVQPCAEGLSVVCDGASSQLVVMNVMASLQVRSSTALQSYAVALPAEDEILGHRWHGGGQLLFLHSNRKLFVFSRGDAPFDGMRLIDTVETHAGIRSVSTATFDGAVLYCVCGTAGVEIYEHAQGDEADGRPGRRSALLDGLPVCILQDFAIVESALSADGSLLAVAAMDGHLGIWRMEDLLAGSRDAAWHGLVEGDRVTSLAFSRCGRQLAAACWDGSVLVLREADGTWQDWNGHVAAKDPGGTAWPSGKAPNRHEAGGCHLLWLPRTFCGAPADGAADYSELLAVTSSSERSVRVFDATANATVATFPIGRPEAAADRPPLAVFGIAAVRNAVCVLDSDMLFTVQFGSGAPEPGAPRPTAAATPRAAWERPASTPPAKGAPPRGPAGAAASSSPGMSGISGTAGISGVPGISNVSNPPGLSGRPSSASSDDLAFLRRPEAEASNFHRGGASTVPRNRLRSADALRGAGGSPAPKARLFQGPDEDGGAPQGPREGHSSACQMRLLVSTHFGRVLMLQERYGAALRRPDHERADPAHVLRTLSRGGALQLPAGAGAGSDSFLRIVVDLDSSAPAFFEAPQPLRAARMAKSLPAANRILRPAAIAAPAERQIQPALGRRHAVFYYRGRLYTLDCGSRRWSSADCAVLPRPRGIAVAGALTALLGADGELYAARHGEAARKVGGLDGSAAAFLRGAAALEACADEAQKGGARLCALRRAQGGRLQVLRLRVSCEAAAVERTEEVCFPGRDGESLLFRGFGDGGGSILVFQQGARGEGEPPEWWACAAPSNLWTPLACREDFLPTRAAESRTNALAEWAIASALNVRQRHPTVAHVLRQNGEAMARLAATL